MIGAKSLVTVVAAVIAAVLTLRSGLLLPERLLGRDASALFLAGAFAVVVGALVFRFWRLNEKSASYFRVSTDATLFENEASFVGVGRFHIFVGRNDAEALELGARTQQLLCVGLALLAGLGAIDSRAMGLLDRFSRGLTAASSSYCPQVEVKPAADDPNAPGCELIRRAYALGYAKDLGDCGVTQARAAAAAVCTLRQRDEPFAHYAFRLLEGFAARVERYASADAFSKAKSDFAARVTRLDSIRSAQREVLSSAPHSAHHIWVNLPDPGTSGVLQRESCADRYRTLAHRPAPGDPSKASSQVFEHVLAQLLFEGRYEPAAGYCREYHVHWGASPDACRQLAANPEGFLEEQGALSNVRAVLDRWRLGRDLEALGNARSQRELDPQAFVSFGCYTETPGTPQLKRSSQAVTLDGLSFVAGEVTVPPSPGGTTLFVDRYDAVATLLTRGFHYGALLSEAGLEQSGSEGLEPSFSSHEFPMSRLYGLEAIDIYLSPGWLAKRADVLEVYPYQVHLKNYVKVFRGQYRRERGRL
jgi:hypothetical protein